MKPLSLALAVLSLASLLLAASAARAAVPRPVPDFTVAGGKSIKAFRGQPVVLVIATSPDAGEFRKEVARLGEEYQGFAARNTIFVAAFTVSPPADGIIKSNIPFVTAHNGASVAANCGITGEFGVIVIGKDGNMDLQTTRFASPSSVRDAILNNFELQTSERRGF